MGLQQVWGQGGSTAGLGAAEMSRCLQFAPVNSQPSISRSPIKYTSHCTNRATPVFCGVVYSSKIWEGILGGHAGVVEDGESVDWKICEIGQLDGQKEH